MENQTNAINWFEIPVLNFERAKEFYSRILDCDMQEMVVNTSRMAFLPSDPEIGVGGAIVLDEGFVPSSMGTRVYLNGGDDLQIVLSRVEGAGGEIIVQKTNIGNDFGFFALFQDTEGNHIGLHSMQ